MLGFLAVVITWVGFSLNAAFAVLFGLRGDTPHTILHSSLAIICFSMMVVVMVSED